MFLTPEPLFLHKYLIGQLSKCYFSRVSLSPYVGAAGRPGGNFSEGTFFYFSSVFGGIHIMHNQNNGSIVFNFVFWLLRKEKKSIDVYVAICSEFIAEWACPCPCQAKGQEAPSLTPSSKSSREFKHKPICERIFCSSVIALVLEFLPKRQVFF